ncbi:DEAD/DEAH box helicase [Tenacibaculum finnmarkense]|uniref:DEAD/DEAH box helicase n=1 Tax=Tenacibaculum finnmarkense TaxID=2781243 RepID=UPI00187BB997|nr:DEAD/DEAH box helicase [Tenacibaculum finnmarkense]MBE7686991.1 DEAD/DEAH box helicase [Tenacibaculum finnmarkense genomovar ulcerans]MCD8399343.1 DEAD/DEAH box helicase [Tenacibaculum finnmarkense genomovar ulcerans]MCD8408978.1 DEAD/DEAH box helicase [Tenacibaculum finnmarkense genomovar ulcerans]MCD8421593.1 DEAD/DEAH box helicase [Tenacibaculum finnmarkense genomovar ulcerans]MCG8748171.1 DEAD/DEAH box helicase [Tenacibaculum finnmarkense]
MKFTDLHLNTDILKALSEQKYHTATLVQQKVIPLVLDKKDVIVGSQTGSGKTAAFALPIIHNLAQELALVPERGPKKIKALVVSPTRELAIQIQESFSTYAAHTNILAGVVYGGISTKAQKETLAKGIDVLVATPGRLIDLHEQGSVDLTSLKTFVLDEADLMLDMGFIHDVKKIEALCPRKKQTLLCSATMPEKVSDLAKQMLYKPAIVNVIPTDNTVNKIGQLLYYTPKKHKVDLCLYLLKNTIQGRILIFRRTKFGVDKLEQTLIKNGYNVTSIHGDKTQILRNQAIDDFKSNKANILIATDVAARGIDIHKIDAVINVDIPNVPETYVHRIGRTGRAGKAGIAFSFCGADETSYIKSIQEVLKRPIKIIEDHPFLLVKPKHIKQPNTISTNKKGRKSEASKKKKKRWY